jgi:hypothetical protein
MLNFFYYLILWGFWWFFRLKLKTLECCEINQIKNLLIVTHQFALIQTNYEVVLPTKNYYIWLNKYKRNIKAINLRLFRQIDNISVQNN